MFTFDPTVASIAGRHICRMSWQQSSQELRTIRSHRAVAKVAVFHVQLTIWCKRAGPCHTRLAHFVLIAVVSPTERNAYLRVQFYLHRK